MYDWFLGLNFNLHTIEIVGSDVIPEFPSWIILPLFEIATLIVIIYRKRIT